MMISKFSFFAIYRGDKTRTFFSAEGNKYLFPGDIYLLWFDDYDPDDACFMLNVRDAYDPTIEIARLLYMNPMLMLDDFTIAGYSRQKHVMLEEMEKPCL